ncbi:hypothetical protein PR048_026735 [Dryococelus australis]|uniref:C2H2-type domain-containing protein n=1 Tax=Dryococelus australis TaxID=614101 RepID=A0ABQ9GM79_9NEOP|nr:hypothetical protein PR048_026735 [Dryococelus australis]
MCKSVQCSERKDCSVIDNNSSSRKTEQESCRRSCRKEKSKKKSKNDVFKKCSHSVKMGGSGNKKSLVAQEITDPGKKSCLCAGKIEPCALHPDKKKHFCTLCGAMFLWKEYLNMHMQSHTAEMPYSCSMCSVKFRLKESLDKHMRFHQGSTSPSCKAVLVSKSSSGMPMKAHALSAPFGCAICNLKFLWQEQLRNHSLVHPDRKLFFCAICGPQFPLEDELFLHVARHSESEQFMCTVCNAVLDSRTDLDSHMSSHFGENVFPCSLCKLPFSSSKLRECHVMLYHRESKQHSCSSPSKEQPASRAVIHDPTSLLGCRRECSADAQQEQGLLMYKGSLQKDQNLHMHMVNGITVFKDFFASRSKNSQYSVKSIECEKIGYPSISVSERQNTDVVDQGTKVSVQEEKLCCDLCNAKFKQKCSLESHIKICHSVKRT